MGAATWLLCLFLGEASSCFVSDTESVLVADSLGKRYGNNWVLRDVSLSLAPGQVLALLGENGAGKSTFVKILSGAVSPDEGRVTVSGRPVPHARPDAARRAGIAMVYQELSVCDDLSVEDNIMLGRERSRLGWLRRDEQRRIVHEVLEKLGHPQLHPQRPVAELSVAAKQLVEIARALAQQTRVLILDEPTSSLAAADAQRLFDTVRKLASDGLSVIYISHFLEEVRSLCDSYLVLRDGRVAGTGSLREVSESQLVERMVGRSVEELYPKTPHEVGEVVLELKGIRGVDSPAGVSLSVRRGEIFGVAGLVGAGRTETMRCLYGLDPVTGGTVRAGQRPIASPAPRVSIARGIAMVSEDRKGEGLAQEMTIRDNTTLSRLGPYQWGGLLNERARGRATEHWMERLRIKALGPDQPVAALSGGNQQKVALARVLHQDADCLILDEPTRGVDVGTKSEIYRLIGEVARQGKAVVFVSSYFQELLNLCDSIAVMSRGQVVDTRPAAEWTEQEMLLAAMGGNPR